MTELAISVEGLSKKYRVSSKTNASQQEEFWALKDLNFQINQGEVIGVIGKNGAGKSTLLKLLSRITYPTEGRIIIEGRLAAMLEVGTGFHPELSGRDNIFLNGLLIGMKRPEIKKKLDEIIAFSGIEKHIDTPVKFYSTGMFLRLAFAVAAHLEVDIMMIDEVLSVGDFAFQKKSLDKIRDTSQSGQTVLMVSHNISSIQQLCQKSIFLDQGRLEFFGDTQVAVSQYFASPALQLKTEWVWNDPDLAPGDDTARALSLRIIGNEGQKVKYALNNQKIGIELIFKTFKNNQNIHASFQVFSINGVKVFEITPAEQGLTLPQEKGIKKIVLWIPPNFLNSISYLVNVRVFSWRGFPHHHFTVENHLQFDVYDSNELNELKTFKLDGLLKPRLEWSIE